MGDIDNRLIDYSRTYIDWKDIESVVLDLQDRIIYEQAWGEAMEQERFEIISRFMQEVYEILIFANPPIMTSHQATGLAELIIAFNKRIPSSVKEGRG